ncbi:MAG: hypothetical protein AAB420_01980 [Patescibacteria group bacterium]
MKHRPCSCTKKIQELESKLQKIGERVLGLEALAMQKALRDLRAEARLLKEELER